MGRSALPPEIREAVKRRSGYDCEIRISPDCSKNGEQLHHRKMRSQLGPDTVANLVDVCNACHRWIHRHPGEAYPLGLLVRSHLDPEETPILLPTRFFGRRWHRLAESGDLVPTAPPLDES